MTISNKTLTQALVTNPNHLNQITLFSMTINLTQDELQSVIDLVDARLERQYNEEYQTILDKLTESQWRIYGS